MKVWESLLLGNFDFNQSAVNFKKNAAYTVKLKELEFEGPLDLLLFLVKKAEIDINAVSIAEITSQYLSYLSLIINMDLDNISEFIEMAATLIYIKSRSLLPTENEYEEDDQDPREELIQRLLEYQKYKIASGVLESYGDDNLYIPRKDAGPKLLADETNSFSVKKTEKELETLSVLDLVSAFAEIMRRKSSVAKKNSYEIEKLEYTVEEKIDFVRSVLSGKNTFRYFEIINEDMSKVEIACCFLAVLELVKQGEAVIRQDALFGDIFVVKKIKSEEQNGSR